ncbi:phage portal protein [Bacteroides sp.]|uniref:phage portal protein n=1 Tax=Bacteroides sp. TaxID=29523 RepID=UPI002FCC75DD
MNLIDRLFKKKNTDIPGIVAHEVGKLFSTQGVRYRVAGDYFSPYVADANCLTLFGTVGEVFFPIDYIASRIAGGKFILKKYADDSVVWDNALFNTLIDRPNCLYSFQRMIYMHFVYKLATGNSYIKCVVPEAFIGIKTPIYKRCRNYWVLPPDNVNIMLKNYIPLFGNAEKSDIIDYYYLQYGLNTQEKILPDFIFHDQDGNADFKRNDFLKSQSVLCSVKMAIDNLIPVYKARNAIFVKRGAIGLLVSAKRDDAGPIAMTPEEKTDLIKEYTHTYGVGDDQFPLSISQTPVDFIRTSMSIQELQPFEETLNDAIMIASAFGIPSVLVPRKDQSTFSNQKTAEKTVYTSKVIPAANRFCAELTKMLGFDKDGYYIEADFSHVDCLQEGQKEKEEVSKIVSERAMSEFMNGIITLNDYRARIGESKVDIPLFDKILYEMVPEEIELVKTIVDINKKESNNGKGTENATAEDKGK